MDKSEKEVLLHERRLNPMKRLSMLLLCLIFLPLAFGCFGGGGGSGARDASRVQASSVTFEAQVPTSALSPAIRADLIPEDIQVLLEGEPLEFVSAVGDVLVYKLTFTDANASFAELLEQGGGVVELTVIVGTKEPVTQELQLDTLTDGSSTKTLIVELIISTNPADGTYTVEVLGSPGVGPLGAPGQSNKSLGITGIDYLSPSSEFLPLAHAIGVPLIDTTIRVTFDSVVDNATNNFRITVSDGSGDPVTITHNDLGSVLSVTQTDVPAGDELPYSYLTFVLLTDNDEGKILNPETQYTLTFESLSVRRKDDPFVRLRPFTILSRTFTTETE